MHGRISATPALLGSVLGLLLAGSVTAPAAAQTRSTTATAAPAAADRRADALHERAARLFEKPQRYREAARLLWDAAALRPVADRRGTDELLLAGRLWYYARDFGNARRALGQAAERALANGEIGRAANAYVDAAFNATAQKRWEEAIGFVQGAERLALSPHLQLAERDAILDRIGPVRVALASRQ